MSVLTVGAAGIAAVLLAVWMKGIRGEYGFYVVIAAQLLFLFYGTGRLKEILDIIRQMEQYIKIRPVYLVTLLKMTGITYGGGNLHLAYARMQATGIGKTDRDFWKADDTGSKYAGAAGSFWNLRPDIGLKMGEIKWKKIWGSGKRSGGYRNI